MTGKLDTDLVGLITPKIEAAMAAPGKKPYAQAAVFYIDNGLDLDKAAAWIDAAIAEQPDAFYLIYQKARVLAKKGDKAGAEAAARLSSKAGLEDHGTGQGRIHPLERGAHRQPEVIRTAPPIADRSPRSAPKRAFGAVVCAVLFASTAPAAEPAAGPASNT